MEGGGVKKFEFAYLASEKQILFVFRRRVIIGEIFIDINSNLLTLTFYD